MSIENASDRGLFETHGKIRDFCDSLFLNDYEKSIKEKVGAHLREIEREVFRRAKERGLKEKAS